MIALGHSSIGAIIGVGIAAVTPTLALGPRLGLAFIAGVISHYIFDWIPHGHYHINFKQLRLGVLLMGLVDFVGFTSLLLGLAVWQYGFGSTFWVISASILGAQAPDLWEIAVHLGIVPQWKWVRTHRHFHHQILHWHSLRPSAYIRIARPLRKSDIWQLGVFALAITLITMQTNA